MAEKPYLVLPPYANLALGSSVTGSVDAAYEPEWLTDGRHDFPVRGPGGGGISLSSSFLASGQADLVVLSHTNLNVSATIGGGLSGSIAADADITYDGIPRNGFLRTTSASVSGVTVAVSGNALVPVIGELFVGLAVEVRPFLFGNAHWGMDDYALDPGGEALSMLPYDRKIAGQTFKGEQLYSTSELTFFQRWFRSTRRGTRLSVLIPDPEVNDAWVVRFLSLTWDAHDVRDMWMVSLEFQEYPRIGW